MIAVKHKFRYLKGTVDVGLVYKSGDASAKGYTDADLGSSILDRKPYTGYIFYLGNSAISWESRKQTTIALSSTEAVYMALSSACKEAVYL